MKTQSMSGRGKTRVRLHIQCLTLHSPRSWVFIGVDCSMSMTPPIQKVIRTEATPLWSGSCLLLFPGEAVVEM